MKKMIKRHRPLAGMALLALAFGLALPAVAQDRSGRYAPDSEIREAFEPVVDQVRQSVLTVIADGDPRGLATVIDRDGLALAKASELVGHEELVVKLEAGEEYPATILNIDRINDLALLKIETERALIPVVFVDEKLKMGEWIVCPGPEARPRAVGIIATIPRGIEAPQLVLGVRLRPHPEGMLVDSLSQGYGAAEAGIQEDDVITHVDNKKVIAIQQVAERLAAYGSGDTVEVHVARDGRSLTMQVELREIQPDPRSRSERMNRMGGEVSSRNSGFENVVQHDAEIEPEDCGGPLVNIDGEVVGLNIARAGRIASYALPTDLVLLRIRELKAGVGDGPAAEVEVEGNVHEAAVEN